MGGVERMLLCAAYFRAKAFGLWLNARCRCCCRRSCRFCGCSEALAGGEFGNGTAQQYGEADVQGRDFSNQVGGIALCAVCVG